MPFSKKKEQKELNLPSLIDVVFLLLIYSLVTIPMERTKSAAEQAQGAKAPLALPFVSARHTVDVDPVLRTLVFQVENAVPDDPASARVLTVLKPSSRDSTIDQAYAAARRDSAFAAFPDGFLALDDSAFARTEACRLVRRALREAKEEAGPASLANRIEIRAVRHTEFRIVNFIMSECGVSGDQIPSIAVRTLSGPE
jgi:biopolymer transport protein ExbD